MNPAFPAKVPAGPVDSRPAMYITGGSRGLGRELVRHFAPAYQVGFGWRNSESDARELTDEVRRAGGRVSAFPCDATDEAALRKTAEEFSREAGPCRVLIHTTGAFNEVPLSATDSSMWREQLESTVTAGFLAWQAFATQLTSHPRSRVIFIGDSAAEQLRARDQAIGYYVGKHGLILLARSIAAAERRHGLTCNVVSPGVMPNSIDLHEPGMAVNVTFTEIAGVIEFLLSPAADAVSGSHLIASRGWNL